MSLSHNGSCIPVAHDFFMFNFGCWAYKYWFTLLICQIFHISARRFSEIGGPFSHIGTPKFCQIFGFPYIHDSSLYLIIFICQYAPYSVRKNQTSVYLLNRPVIVVRKQFWQRANELVCVVHLNDLSFAWRRSQLINIYIRRSGTETLYKIVHQLLSI